MHLTQHLVGIGATLATHQKKVYVVGQKGHSTDDRKLVFALFDGANTNHIAFGQSITGANGGYVLCGDRPPKHWVARLIEDTYFVGRHLHDVDKVAARLLTDGDNHIGHTAGMALLELVYFGISQAKILRVAPGDEVVHGHQTGDRSGEAEGQFVAEAMKQIDPIGGKAAGEGSGTPEMRECTIRARGAADRHIGIRIEKVAVLRLDLWRVEQSPKIGVPVCKRADKETAIIAQARSIAESTFGIETDKHC